MMKKEINNDKDFKKKLIIDCEKCCGLCCVALYCMKSDGFPANKIAGKPCQNLMPDFRCAIHSKLVQSKMKGCLAYDCFGAGQKVTQDCFPAMNWNTHPKKANQIFDVFLVVFGLHQMLWYLIEASTLNLGEIINSEIDALIGENERMTALVPDDILNLDVNAYRLRVNELLKEISNTIANPTKKEQNRDFFGKDFKGADLDGKDFSMSLMIAANLEGCSLRGTNFLGADMRDVNIKNTDLSQSVFLTQMQINAAKGNSNTKLPDSLAYPKEWKGDSPFEERTVFDKTTRNYRRRKN